jgi:3-hydroxybutyryl-CoA dehydrogenase
MVRAGKLGVKSKEGFYDYSENKKAEKISKQLYKSRAGSRNFS